MKEKQIKLTVDQAKSMLGKSVEMDELLKANFTPEELGLKKALPKRWEELELIKGYYIMSGDSKIDTLETKSKDSDNYNVFKTKAQAESALAMAQLSQLKYVYNEGKEIDWTDNSIKHCISRIRNSVCVDISYSSYNFLTFNNKEIRDEFLTNFRPLIEKYFML